MNTYTRKILPKKVGIISKENHAVGGENTKCLGTVKRKFLKKKIATFADKGATSKEKITSIPAKGSTSAEAVSIAAVFLFAALLLFNSSTAASAVNRALIFSFKSLIPSLFPFMVAGEVLLLSGLPALSERLFGRLFYRCFEINGKGASAFLIGAFCGFPTGARSAVSLYLNGELEREDAERLAGICNNGGIGFIVSGIGVGIWGSTAFGAALYLSGLFSAAIAGFMLNATDKKRHTKEARATKPADGKAHPETDFSLSGVLSSAVASAALSMVKVIGFVLFFELLISLLSELMLSLGATTLTVTLLSSFTEVTAGARSIFALTERSHMTQAAKILTFQAVSWGGLSVYMQFSAFATPAKIKTGIYLKTKLLQSLICTLIGTVLVLFGVI